MGHKSRNRKNRKKNQNDPPAQPPHSSSPGSNPPDDPTPTDGTLTLSTQPPSSCTFAESGCSNSQVKMSGPPEMRKFNMSKSGNADTMDKITQERTFAKIEDFLEATVEDPEMRRPIYKILISTNGIAALKCLLYARRESQRLFGNNKIIQFICLTTDQENDAKAEYVKLADLVVFAPAGDNRNNYANVDVIVHHAVEHDVDAVWAGWGHASENPELPRRLKDKGIIFIGPPASAMFALGDKIASTLIAQTVDIPTIQWSGSGIKLDLDSCTVDGIVTTVNTEVFQMACVSDVREGLAAVERHQIGYPLMIKASEGGGGKGIRKCKNDTDFRENFVHVQTEVPGSPIFIMKCIENARHIEVQLIADRYGTVIPLNTRDCSIQRRCQKIIEEAPATAAPEHVLRRMQEDAMRIAKLVGYESAGTVEYMFLPEDNSYFFLELNPRLQVEHPCTEMITDVNIIAMQIQLAMGVPMRKIRDIRQYYGYGDHDPDELPADLVRTQTNKHCIAARITSEDPDDFFRPSTGSITTLNFHSNANVWGYFSVSPSAKVHEFADSQFGHLFAMGKTRHEAMSNLLCALKELELSATFPSQVAYLVDLLKTPEFINNQFNTQWLDNRIANKVCPAAALPKHQMIAVSSAVIGYSRITSIFNNFKTSIERGQVLPMKTLTETIMFDLVKDMQIYKITVTRSGPLIYYISLNGRKTMVEVRPHGDGGTLVIHKNRSFTCSLEETSDKFKVKIGRDLVLFEKDNDPTILTSPYTGKLLSFKKANKEWHDVGCVYATVESMKLVFDVEIKKAPGRLEHVAKEGDALFRGSVIARLVDQQDSEKYKPKPFLDHFPEWECSSTDKDRSELKKYNLCYESFMNILNGSIPMDGDYKPKELVDEMFDHLASQTLPAATLDSILSPIRKRLPEKWIKKIDAAAKVENITEKFNKIQNVLDEYFTGLPNQEWENAKAISTELYLFCGRFTNATLSNTAFVLNSILAHYLESEKFFESTEADDAIARLNEEYGSDKDRIVQIIYSHTQLEGKSKLMSALLTGIEERGMHLVTPLVENLRDIGNLFKTGDICEMSRKLLLQNNSTKYRKFLNKIIWDMEDVPLKERDTAEVLPVESAVGKLRGLFKQMMISGASPKQLLEKSAWTHKAIHEFFFDEDLEDFAVRAYIERHFSVGEVKQSALAGPHQEATVYDFFVDNDNLVHYMISPSDKSNQYLSIVKFSVNKDNFMPAVTHANLIDSLVSKYGQNVARSNGLRSQLRLTLLVNVIQEAVPNKSVIGDRDAKLEELPKHSTADITLLAEAEQASVIIRTTLAEKLNSVDITTHVIVCNQNKPLVQVDLLGAERLELWRLPSNASMESDRMSNLHVYKCDDEKENSFSRLFVREMVEMPLRIEDADFHEKIQETITSHLDNACGAINVTMRKYKNKSSFVSNHVFLHVTFPKLPVNFTREHQFKLEKIFIKSIKSQRYILYKHHVAEVEIVLPKVHEGGRQLVNHRVKFLDDTGVTPEFGIYDENKRQLEPLRLSHQLYGQTLECYDNIKKIEKKRVTTRRNNTTYVYDYPNLFGRACMEEWKKLQEKVEQSGTDAEKEQFALQLAQLSPAQQCALVNSNYRMFFNEEELVIKDGKLEHISSKEEMKSRADNCSNESGMVAWLLKLFTPEKPLGYTIVAIANDITFQTGSFATPEDEVYSLASEYSRKNKLPRVNVSCNSGARIGLAEEVAKCFRVHFKDDENPSEGFDYLYIDEADEHKLQGQILTEKMPNGHLKLKAVIGREKENIGVENLQGSGLIAGETSAAYEEVPTYCYVTGRSVGIGAYTARLAHRIVQARTSNIILTGAAALNTVLGKEVYTSNNQLGGIQIMHKNGVTHSVVADDFEGICKIVQWMSYLPVESTSFPYRQAFGLDAAPRPVEFVVEPNKPFDIRQLIDSGESTDVKGICDSGSFDEIMSEWAKTIIAGRARIGGIPIGVVSSELRNVMTVTPADPAAPNSQSVEIHQAGQVWYPDSAYKTAEVIGDFNREGLPLLFIASLRGFSGGQKDMYDMVLKFGAQIVDALRKYRMPVVIYIPTGGELRGGAWAVLDSQINPGIISMVADKESRGGILEANAIVGIKFKKEKVLALQKRTDSVMRKMSSDLIEETTKNGPTSVEAKNLTGQLNQRAKDLEKAYRGPSVEFADLHDRADRMLRRKAVQHVTDLSQSRNLFTEIFRVESAKIALSERYRDAARNVNPNEAYKWVAEQFEKFEHGVTSLPPADQMESLRRFVESGQFHSKVNGTREESVEKELMMLSPEIQQRLLERLLSRKNSI